MNNPQFIQFREDYRRCVVIRASSLDVSPRKEAGLDSNWIFFKQDQFDSLNDALPNGKVHLIHKLTEAAGDKKGNSIGCVDIQFPNVEQPEDALRRAFQPLLEGREDFSFAKFKEGSAIRVIVPPIDYLKGLEAGKDKVDAALNAADALLRWFLINEDHIRVALTGGTDSKSLL